VGPKLGRMGFRVGLGVGIVDGIADGEGLGNDDGLAEGIGVVGDIDGLMLGDNVGSTDKGVGCKVVGVWDGLGLGIIDGILLGDIVGTVVGEGVVGDGVLMGVGRRVGVGVGTQVVQTRFSSFREPPDVKPLS